MDNHYTKINPERLYENLQLIEVDDNLSLIAELKKLLIEYGNYMYLELGLIAG